MISLAASHALQFDGEKFKPADEDLVVLFKSRELPPEILDAIGRIHPRFQKKYSKRDEFYYYLNTCECGVHFDDFDLHIAPGAIFTPPHENDARYLMVEKLPLSGQFEINAQFMTGRGKLILKTHPQIADELIVG